jgi:hypothetical protein
MEHRGPTPLHRELEELALMQLEAGEAPGAILERPDGYYWKSPDGLDEYGPFESCEAALADRDAMGDEAPDGVDDLHDVERDIGINEWIDAETGEPAEGQSPPHLELE